MTSLNFSGWFNLTNKLILKPYALDTKLSLARGAGQAQLLTAMEGHVLAQAELVGTSSCNFPEVS